MRPLRLAVVAVLIAAVAVLAVTAAAEWPKPVECGSGGGSESNVGTSVGGGNWTNATYETVPPFPKDAHITFSWSTPDGTVATFRVLSPTGASLYTVTAASGSGSFTASVPSGSMGGYGFGIALNPPNETVDYSYVCTTAS
jgi:hypothetical protein